VNDVCVGINFTCAIIADGGVRCFGLGTSGQLGGANLSSSSAPVTTDLREAARQVACHQQSTCATTELGVACWGDNSAGQLGAASPVLSATPVYVTMP
jgi:alpha-tubulin suppressor-like RCC1 family protein